MTLRKFSQPYATALGLVLAFNFAAEAAPMSVMNDGQIHAAIVIGKDATPVERFAAEELQSYAAQLAPGPKLPIVAAGNSLPPGITNEILIGRPETNPRLAVLCTKFGLTLNQKLLGGDGYIVKSVTDSRENILLLGGSHDRSALFAVYELLESCGVRFFGYRSHHGEIVPRRAALVIPNLDIVEKPHMDYRFVSNNGFSASDKTKLHDVADWGAKNRCNSFVLTRARAGDTSWNAVALDEVQKRGFMIAGPGHCLAQFTPSEDLFKTHPEYFPLIKGKRNPVLSKEWSGATAFCYSNPEAMRIVVSNAVKYFDQHPFIDLFAIYPPDGSQHGVQCQCEACSKMTMSDHYLTLLNNVAQALKSRPSPPKLMWISYNECSVPPPHVRPFENGRDFVLLWCNELREHGQPMDSEANRHATRSLQWKPRLREIKTDWKAAPTDKDLAAWYRWRAWSSFLKADHYAGSIALLEYYNEHVSKSLHVPMLGYCQSGPWPGDLMQKDFQFYCNEGITGWQNCTDYYNDKPNPYWNRLNAQLMWNPGGDLSAINRDFYQQFYGPAGATMEKYFTALWPEIASSDLTLASCHRVENLSHYLDEAGILASNAPDPAFGQRVTEARSFQKHCLETKQEISQNYRPDGSPK